MLRVLIIKRDKFGDLVLTTPLIRYLAGLSVPPEGVELSVLLPAQFSFLLKSSPYIFKIFEIPQKKGSKLRLILEALFLWLRLLRVKFDYVVVASGEPTTSGLRVASMLRAKHIVAYLIPDVRRSKHIGVAECDAHELHRILKLGQKVSELLGGRSEFSPDFMPRINLTNDQDQLRTDFLARQGLQVQRYFIVGIGCRKLKRKPSAAQIKYLANHFQKTLSLRCVLSWTPTSNFDPGYPSDDEIAAKILVSNGEIIPLAGTLLEAIAVVKGARFCVFPDSGLMHASAALGVPTLGLFSTLGNAPPAARWRPIGTATTYIEVDTEMSCVSPQVYVEKIDKMLSET
jgi:ADP-heptose:LPS heptosyltransferase